MLPILRFAPIGTQYHWNCPKATSVINRHLTTEQSTNHANSSNDELRVYNPRLKTKMRILWGIHAVFLRSCYFIHTYCFFFKSIANFVNMLNHCRSSVICNKSICGTWIRMLWFKQDNLTYEPQQLHVFNIRIYRYHSPIRLSWQHKRNDYTFETSRCHFIFVTTSNQ